MTRRSHRQQWNMATVSTLSLLLAAMALAPGCAHRRKSAGVGESAWAAADPTQLGHEDLLGFMHAVTIDEQGRPSRHHAAALRIEATTFGPLTERKTEPPEHPMRPTTSIKLHPLVDRWLRTMSAGEGVEVLVQLADPFAIPRLPDLPMGVERDSPEGERVMEKRRAAIAELKRSRDARQAGFVARLDAAQAKGRERVEVLEQFWLVNVLLVRTPIRVLAAMAEDDQVVYLQPRFAGEKPPQDANANNDAADGRARIVSDPYFDLGLTGGWIGLLDTGVRRTHTMFTWAAGLRL